MINEFSRTEILFGEEKMNIIKNARVAVFGVGGVGGFVTEALARIGISTIDLIDNDTVSITNINRQIIALHSTIGMPKVEVMKARILDINPSAEVNTHICFYTPETSGNFNFAEYDYVVDAIDTVTGKIEIVMQAQKSGVPVISSMGTGNKLNPAELEITDIYKTSVCPLARVMRYELKKRGVKRLKVLYSKEKPLVPMDSEELEGSVRRTVPGSTSFVPPVAGMIIASEVIKDLINREN